MLLWLTLALVATSKVLDAIDTSSCSSKHLFVMCHGLGGTSDDLQYLGGLLTSAGATVLASKENEALKSFHGVQTGGRNLADEVLAFIKLGEFTQISFVGNSLGGGSFCR